MRRFAPRRVPIHRPVPLLTPAAVSAIAIPVLVLGTLALALLAPAAHAASPPVPGKKGPQAPRYGRAGVTVTPEGPPIFRSGNRAPTTGTQTISVLAIRVSFSDTPIESSTVYYNRLLLFLNQYWTQVSDGQVDLATTLWDSVFTLPRPMAYYGDDDRFQERLVHLIRDTVTAADSTVDFRPYQSLIVFHAGQGQEADVFDDSREQIWSAFVTKDDFAAILPDTTGSGAVGIATNDSTAGVPRRITEAVEAPESESQDGYVFGMSGVLFHEFGHQLGTLRGQISMPDLYDTTPDEGGYSQGIGAWDIMAGGVWNANGFVPAGPSVWTRVWLGFLQPQRVLTTGLQSLAQLERPAGPYPRALEIPITQSEHFLIENRRRDLDGNGTFTFDDANQDGCFDFYEDSYAGAEFDFFLPAQLTPPGAGCDAGSYQSGDGVLIYHIDDAKIEARLRDNTVNGDTRRKGVDVEEADGIQDLDDPPASLNAGSPEDVFRAGWRDRFAAETNPSSDAYPDVRTGISVSSISVPESVMTMTITIDRTRPGWPKTLTGRIRNLPSVAADLDGDGTLELIVPLQRLNNTGAVYVFRHDGNDFLDGDATPTPFVVTATAPTSSPCVGDIDGAPGVEIVFQTLDRSVYAFHANGTEVLDGDADPATQGVLFAPSGPGTTHAQPILVDLNGDAALEIVTGGPFEPQGSSTLRAISIQGTTRTILSLPMGGSTEGPAAAADLDGDGFPEIVITNQPSPLEEGGVTGLSIASWELFMNDDLPDGPGDAPLYQISGGGPYSAVVLADVDRDGIPEVVVADAEGAYHAFHLDFGSHIPIDPPSQYVTARELAGWPSRPLPHGRLSEVSIGDLERDGYPEVLHTGDLVRVVALHWNGAPRAGYPLRPAAPFADADTAGAWPPLVADVDGDGVRDVIPILPDGRRPAYRADGAPIDGFEQLGSTGSGAPPLLLDLNGDGTAEWIEAHDLAPPQAVVTVRDPWLPVAVTGIAWSQYRNAATRNAVVPAGPGAPAGGTRNLTAVYAYPNPSRNGATTIHYRLSEAATSVSVRILDPTGATVADLPVTLAQLAGSAEHAVTWSHTSSASGVYLCRVEVRSGRGTEVEFATLAVVR